VCRVLMNPRAQTITRVRLRAALRSWCRSSARGRWAIRPQGTLAVPVFAHGSLEVELYSPRGVDSQQPHSRDEVYVVACGEGVFFDGRDRHAVQQGAFIFVRAGQEHRFENFSSDFTVWVLFYGPEGGEGDTSSSS
jgi:mannose-6-phosphate isomerase-like protein (cupin superfamily)